MPDDFEPAVDRQKGRSVLFHHHGGVHLALGYEDEDAMTDERRGALDRALRASIWQMKEMLRLGLPLPTMFSECLQPDQPSV